MVWTLLVTLLPAAAVQATSITLSVRIGWNSCVNASKCVKAPPGLIECARNAGDPGVRINEDWKDAPDTFDITVQEGYICAKRTDTDDPSWGQDLTVQCVRKRCEWIVQHVVHSSGYADFEAVRHEQREVAKHECIQMGSERCRAISCTYNHSATTENCTIRASPAIQNGSTAEVTYTPSSACFVQLDNVFYGVNTPDILFSYLGRTSLLYAVIIVGCCYVSFAVVCRTCIDPTCDSMIDHKRQTEDGAVDTELVMMDLHQEAPLLSVTYRKSRRCCARCNFCNLTRFARPHDCKLRVIICSCCRLTAMLLILIAVHRLIFFLQIFAYDSNGSAREHVREHICAIHWMYPR